jgi:nucleoid-associated protein YgaU
MTRAKYSNTEWKSLVNAPHWVYATLTAAERGNIFTRRSEAKALRDFLSSYRTRSPLVKEIIEGQKDADDKLEGSLEDGEKALRQVGFLLERKADDDEGDAVRDFLMSAGEAVAEAAREERRRGGKPTSAKEKETLAQIEVALKATDADKRRRREAVIAAEAARRAQAERQAEAKKRAAETEAKRKAAQAEAERKAAEAEAKRKAAEAEAKRKAAEAEAKRRAADAEAKERAEKAKAARKAAEAEAARKAAEAEAKEKAEKARAARKAAEAEAKEAKDRAERTKAARQAAEAEAKKKAEEAAAAAAVRTYVVKPGDTLSGIAKSMYGNAGRWPEIFEANRDVIEKPNLIRPGWKLRIPD